MRLIERLAGVFVAVPILVVTDSWFGNQGLLKPLRAALGPRTTTPLLEHLMEADHMDGSQQVPLG